jgi:hypothetical protein
VTLLSGFGVILGYMPNSSEEFWLAPIHPPLVASSVLQYTTAFTTDNASLQNGWDPLYAKSKDDFFRGIKGQSYQLETVL